jgi:hypothetical protein
MFLLYSVGFDEKDDGGNPEHARDFVWLQPASADEIRHDYIAIEQAYRAANDKTAVYPASQPSSEILGRRYGLPDLHPK